VRDESELTKELRKCTCEAPSNTYRCTNCGLLSQWVSRDDEVEEKCPHGLWVHDRCVDCDFPEGKK
jgi:hypothetical protein